MDFKEQPEPPPSSALVELGGQKYENDAVY